MSMTLVRFRVKNFRSIEDSLWVDAENITALIGTNESGKTNLLLPLWKLNPAKGGEINPKSDYPRKSYADIKNLPDDKKPIFIEAEFLLPKQLINFIATKNNSEPKGLERLIVSKNFAGKMFFNFPDFEFKNLSAEVVLKLSKDTLARVKKVVTSAEEATFKETSIELLKELSESDETYFEKFEIDGFLDSLSELLASDSTKNEKILEAVTELKLALERMSAELDDESPEENAQILEKLKQEIPSFVYYSNYGNLDSEIYLPHVIDNFKRNDLGAKEEAKTRTLQVLFDFVQLKPDEILSLGQDKTNNSAPAIEEERERKKERSILLQSASTKLSKEFKDWWKQGEYRFRFDADGNHFIIWVSDQTRPEEIELGNRSTGLQWFLSFYLTFLVESKGSHSDAILLLDEPGISLHPLAQKDLSYFFENLSKTNQLIYTTHSPFLVDSDHLYRVKAVYVGEDGSTKVSSNLRAGKKKDFLAKSIYPVHAALGLSVSDTMLQGCLPIVVEGPSDQVYLSFIKNVLLSKNKLTINEEVLFIPSGGVKGVKTLSSIVMSKDNELPVVLVDGDKAGREFANSLRKDLYLGNENLICSVDKFIMIEDAEIEDIFPQEVLVSSFAKIYRNTEESFEDVCDSRRAIIPQMKKFAADNNISLREDWKVELAKEVVKKMKTLIQRETPVEEHIDVWEKVFTTLTKPETLISHPSSEVSMNN